MNPAGCSLLIGCLLLLPALPLFAGNNSLLIPAQSRCVLGMPGDGDQAMQECQQMATGGDSQAQFELGEFFYLGRQVPQNLPQAVHWLEQASLQGHARAQLRLGQLFWHGEGVPANRVQAYIVLKMSAINGSEDAIDEADQLATQMSRAELERATRVLGEIFRDYLQELDRQPQAAPATDAPLAVPAPAPGQ